VIPVPFSGSLHCFEIDLKKDFTKESLEITTTTTITCFFLLKKAKGMKSLVFSGCAG